MARSNLESIIEESLRQTSYPEPLNTIPKTSPQTPTFRFQNYVILSVLYAGFLVSMLFWASYSYATTHNVFFLFSGLAMGLLIHLMGIMHKEFFFSSHLIHSPIHKVNGYVKYMVTQVGLYSLMQFVVFGFGLGIISLFIMLDLNVFLEVFLVILMVMLTLFIHDVFVHNLITYSISFGTGFITQFDKTMYNLRVFKQSFLKSLTWSIVVFTAFLISRNVFSITRFKHVLPFMLALVFVFVFLIGVTDYKQRKQLLHEVPDLVMDNLPHSLIPLVEKNLENLSSDIFSLNQELYEAPPVQAPLDPLEPLDSNPFEPFDSTSRSDPQVSSSSPNYSKLSLSEENTDSSAYFDPKSKTVVKHFTEKQDFDSAFPKSKRSTVLYCPVCSMPNDSEYQFCYNCGSPLINSDTFRET